MAHIVGGLRFLLLALAIGILQGCPGGSDSGLGLDGGSVIITPSRLTFAPEEWEKSVTVLAAGFDQASFTATSEEEWLQVTPTSGTVGAEGVVVTVVASRSGMSDGEYVGRIRFLASGKSPVWLEVTLRVLSPGVDLEREPNNTVQQANTISAGRPMWGTVGAANDPRDVFIFHNPANTFVELAIRNRAPEGGPFTDIGNIEWGPVGDFFYLRRVSTATDPLIPPGKTLYLGVLALGEGPVVTSIAGGQGYVTDYELRLSSLTVPVQDVGEPNDTFSTATVWRECNIVNASIGFGQDRIDWYRVESSVATVRRIRVTNTTPSDVINSEFNVFVSDAEGRALHHELNVKPGDTYESLPIQFFNGLVARLTLTASPRSGSTYRISCR